MDPIIIGALGVVLILALILFGVPIGFSLGVVGLFGTMIIGSPQNAIMQAGMVAWNYGTLYTIVAVPMYLVMGNIVANSGFSQEIYLSIYKWVGRLPGGLAVATTFACAAFGAVCGSSMATIAAIGTMAIPEMKRYKYDNAFATACLCASGTLAIMIPPSLGMIYYAIFTEVSIGKLFIAGILPGILSAVAYAVIILIRAKRNPTLGPPGPLFPWRERLSTLIPIWPVALLFILVVGGIYGGIFTAAEAAGIGAFGAVLIGLVMQRLSRKAFSKSVAETGRTCAMALTIVFGAILFQRFLTITGIAPKVAQTIVGLHLNADLFMAALIILYLFLGCILDIIGMLALTIPFIFPAVLGLGMDPIWFGIILVKLMEVGLVTPPVGFNLFIMKSIAPEVPFPKLIKNVSWFLLMDLVTIVILIRFPIISLWLPSIMMGR